MSRVGKVPITIPSEVEVIIDKNHIKVKGAKGELEWNFPQVITVIKEEDQIIVKRNEETSEGRAKHGLTRALIQNMITGVSVGFTKSLEINGVGYRAQVSGKKLTMNLGFSHPINVLAPEGVTIAMDEDQKNVIVVSGIDKQAVGEVAANIRKFRPPEPYKGKGIRYTDEYVRRKAGKTAASKE